MATRRQRQMLRNRKLEFEQRVAENRKPKKRGKKEEPKEEPKKKGKK